MKAIGAKKGKGQQAKTSSKAAAATGKGKGQQAKKLSKAVPKAKPAPVRRKPAQAEPVRRKPAQAKNPDDEKEEVWNIVGCGQNGMPFGAWTQENGCVELWQRIR